MKRVATPLLAIILAAVVVIGVCCDSGDESDDSPDTGTYVESDAEVPSSPAAPVCVWNQAYQENSDADSVNAILAGARDCYVLLDPFEDSAAANAIPALTAAGNTVGCYISVGTCENWRSDYDAMRMYCTTVEWAEWEGEFFVSDVEGIEPFMHTRIDQMAMWGCDMVELDNMDFADDEEQSERFDLGVTPEQAVTYNQGLCEYVHGAGMECMAKNLRHGSLFDGGTFESYSDERDWWEHDDLQSFVDEGHLAVIFHYDESNCDSVALWYRQRYGAGVSFLCEDRAVGGYWH